MPDKSGRKLFICKSPTWYQVTNCACYKPTSSEEGNDWHKLKCLNCQKSMGQAARKCLKKSDLQLILEQDGTEYF